MGCHRKYCPHNFNELIEASIAFLRDESYTLYPDFLTGGSVDVSKYNDGERGGSVKVRAKISKLDNKTLVVTEIPYGKTTTGVIESILKANDKGKIKLRKVDDNTAQYVEILVHLAPGVSSDKTIDALYAFSDCEVSISPNCCIIYNNRPAFLTVSDLLKYSTENTKRLLNLELEIHRNELMESLLFNSLEKIFIEERIYKDKAFEESKDMDHAISHIDKRLEPYKPTFYREITKEDILKLMEIKMGRILKFNTEKADELIASLKDQIELTEKQLENMVGYTIEWFESLQKKYGKQYPRRTEIRNFDTIVAAKVVEANEKLYINREEGFIGTSLKKDKFVCACSSIDDVILFYKDGKLKVVKVSEKMFIGKNILYINVFKKNDTRTIYNMVYRNGKDGAAYIKRFAVNGITRDKEYDLSQGLSGSRVMYFSANPNGEAEVIRITHKPGPRIKKLQFDKDFSEIAIKGRQSMGNIVSKNDILRIALKQKGGSTLGGRQVWFDHDVLRLNYDGRGEYLGEFQSDDCILVITKNGHYRTTNFDLSNHYEDNIRVIERFKIDKIWTAALYDADQQGFPYLKRFTLEPSPKQLSILGDNPATTLIFLTDTFYPRIKVAFGGNDSFRESLEIDADEFISVKSFKAKGKRLTTFAVEAIQELEPIRFPEVAEEQPSTQSVEIEEDEEGNTPDSSPVSQTDIEDEIVGQMKLFD